VDAPLVSSHELVRPWRRATFVVGAVAAVELVLLLGAGVFLLAKPISRAVKRHAEATALPAPKKPQPTARLTSSAAVTPKLTREQTSVIVFNGNGQSGAAANAAARLHALGYVIAGTGNARRQDYAATVVMYRGGFRGEALRLARDLHVKVVGPLDGMRPAALMGGQLAIIVGAAA
jgi:hypothetical protein